MTVPDEYVPELAARQIKLVLTTEMEQYPGVVYYEYRSRDGRESVSEAELASVMYDSAAGALKWQYPDREQLRAWMAEVAAEDDAAAIEEGFLTQHDQTGATVR